MDINEEEERELEAAESEFMGGPTEGEEGTQPKVAQQAMTQKALIEHYQEILIALGFTRYDNGDKGIAYKLNVPPLQVGRTFTTVMPIGNMWVRCLEDCEYGKKNEFMKREDIKQIPQVDLFYRIREGELPIPESNVSGKIVGKSEEAVHIQFTEFSRIETKWWGLGALKKTHEGITYIPASYSKKTQKYDAKMQVPRDIILTDYDAELKNVPTTATGDTGRHAEEPTEKVEKATLAEALHVSKPETTGNEEEQGSNAIAGTMRYYLKQGRKMVESIFPELEQPQLSELSQDIATTMFIEDSKVTRKDRW